MACLYVFPACPAEMLLTMVEDLKTFHLDGKRQSQVGNVYNRLVCFQVRSVCVDGLSRGGIPTLQKSIVTYRLPPVEHPHDKKSENMCEH